MVIVYRSGGLPELKSVANRNALWFDALTNPPRECSPRAGSVFACASQDEALGWVDWRLGGDLDADIWAITIPDNVNVYQHLVEHYENARFVQGAFSSGDAEQDTATSLMFAEKYWAEKKTLNNLNTPPEGQYWEVLIPYYIALNAEWVLVEKIVDIRETVTTYFD